ncbi:MAG TPA: hypothetical protein VF309_02505 [Usitatibacter sp.]
MKSRDEYVAKLKTDLDRWNVEAAKWEAQAASARADLKKGYTKQLETLRAQREATLYKLKLLEGASATAWTELERGADEAWASMKEAMAAAKSHFEKAHTAK